jgi:choline dehydrogenase-like flavoprotein
MLIDANELPANSRIDCDICIAGSGPAGMTLAVELAGTPLRVCLLESGGLSPAAAVQVSTIAEQLGISIDLAKFQQHSFGGVSNRWGGLSGRWFRLKPLDPIDFEARPWIANSGWPFAYDALRPFFDRAGRILQVRSIRDFSVDAQRRRLAPEFHNDELHTTIFLMAKPLRFGEHYRSLLAQSNNVQVYFNGRVTEIEEDPISPVIRHFRLATAAGKRHRVCAKFYVLACGGLENPRLLLASKRKATAGVGNRYGLVGRYYMQHPKGLHGIAVLNREAARAHLYTHGHLAGDIKICGGISFSESYQRQQRMLNHCIMLRPLFSLSEGYVSQLYRAMQRGWHGSDRGAGRRELRDLARFAAAALKFTLKGNGVGTVFSVLNHMEQIPKLESRLDLSEQRDPFGVNQLRIDWRIDPFEKASLCRLHEVVRDHLAAQGMGTLESQLDPLAGDWPIVQDSAHHMGTTRIHVDPKQGVTDAHGRVHGVRNLYISGNSLLPTSGHANPTLTVVALAIRLAEHLRRLCTASDAMVAIRPETATTLAEAAPLGRIASG